MLPKIQTKWHYCYKKTPFELYGVAIDTCWEEQGGTLWVTNKEYQSQVSFCPFCGFKAKTPALEIL